MQIVMPIFNAFEVTHDAIAALKQHNQNDAVLLIDDASTDPRIQGLMQNLPTSWQVIQNKHNLGFVKSANIGLQQNSGHSILLNSDTLVTVNWLQRFEQVIHAIDDLGTATPWSNNAEICSFPKTLTANTIPADLNALAVELAERHPPLYPELPTAVGFCMLITEKAKKQVGYFDEATFGLGYGEENDYSLRVSAASLRNVLVDNCYVAHIGNQSFKERSLQPDQHTMDRLLAKHPNYLQLIQKFIEKNPLAELRQSIIDKITAF